ncbi:MAG: FxsA family protein [Actinobacteria bacterium]|nr:FxsA family protein [Actinomycetota bacterium]
MGAVVAALLVIIPIVEILVFAVVAEAIGVLPTILLLISVSVAGAVLLVRQGIGTWRRLRATVRRGERPTDDLMDAALIAGAGALFLTPGFFTDAIAFLVVIPATRRTLRRVLRRAVAAIAATRFGWKGTAAVATKKVYEVRATSRSRRGSGSPERPERLPSAEHPSDEAGSRDRG